MSCIKKLFSLVKFVSSELKEKTIYEQKSIYRNDNVTPIHNNNEAALN